MSKELEANNIRLVVIEHKRLCKRSDCVVSMFLLGVTYKRLKGRELTKEETEVFL